MSSGQPFISPTQPALDYADSVREAEMSSQLMWIRDEPEQDPRVRQTLIHMLEAVAEMRMRTQHAIDQRRSPVVPHKAIEFTPEGSPSPNNGESPPNGMVPGPSRSLHEPVLV
jgi:hypothetical protein